jgi:hypothetical protein
MSAGHNSPHAPSGFLGRLVAVLGFLTDGLSDPESRLRDEAVDFWAEPIPAVKPCYTEPPRRPVHKPRCPAVKRPLCYQSPVGCFCRSKGGKRACRAIQLHFLKAGATLPVSFFSNTPQQHALMNRHLQDYFRGRQRSLETTPYNVPASQRHLLAPLGMEQPQPDAPEAPHAFHKSIEEHQLRGMRRLLPPDNYNLISVKNVKLPLLPTPAIHQNPMYDAKDPSRYPGNAVRSATFAGCKTIFAHDIASVAGPHELAQRLSDENPEGHLFVTGVNPAEVLDGAVSFEPASHTIEYDVSDFHWIMTGSESESYTQPINVTVSWHRTSSVTVKNGRVYQVVLLDYKLGHCLWHIFCGDVNEQETRIYPTGSMVRVPPALSGTLTPEYIPVNLLSACLEFVRRTPDQSSRNLAAKVTQVANGVNPKTTSRERWILLHIMEGLEENKTWWVFLKRAFWKILYALSFQWQMLGTTPEVYQFLDERKRTRIIHPTPGGGWSLATKSTYRKRAIPNYPTALQRLSVLTASVFTFVLPKLALGDVLAHVVWNADWFMWIRKIFEWADVRPLRAILTVAIVVVTAIIPGHIVKIFSRLSGHFWRQLWLPGWTATLSERIITEICGGPGALWLSALPGRGWAYQAMLWAIALHSFLPGLVAAWVQPWVGWFWVSQGCFNPYWAGVMSLWLLAIVVENLTAYLPDLPMTNYVLPPFVTFSDPYGRSQGIRNPFLWLALALAGPVARGFARVWNKCLQFRRHQNSLGNCQRSPYLDAVATVQPPPVRRRHVDIPLPSVTVLPASIPVVNAPGTLAVNPQGMEFGDFVNAVQTAYQANPNAYPALTPGMSCFWDCVAPYGGSPHMWYSWFMAVTQATPDLTQPIGPVTIPEMQVFAALSHFGLNIRGLAQNVTAAQGGGWPTINVTITRGSINGFLHVTPTDPNAGPAATPALASILATIRGLDMRWYNFVQAEFNRHNASDVPQPTPALLGFLGTNSAATTMDEIADALVASFYTPALTARTMGTFQIDLNRVYVQPWDPLFHYGPRQQQQRVAQEPSAKTWQRFRALGSRVSRWLRISDDYTPVNAHVHLGTKVGATPSQVRDNSARGNQVPAAPRWVELRNELFKATTEYHNIALPAVPLTPESLQFTADVGRAARLAADLKAHPSVLEARADQQVIQALDAIIDMYRAENKTVTVPMTAYFGIWGSGKTTATRNFLHSLPPEERAQARVVSHTESLRAKAKKSLDFPEMRGYNFPTLASLITEPSTGVVILDDAGKFWGGLLDLVVLANPLLTEVVVNGDPLQGLSSFPVQGTQSKMDPTAIEVAAAQATKYATITHRGFRLLADTLGVHTTNANQGHITHTVQPKVGIPVCTASPRYVQVLSGAGREAYTYESVQGEDFGVDMEIDMTGLEGAILDRSGYVALTRSKTGNFIHMDAADPRSVIKSPPSGSDIVNALVYAMRAGQSASLQGPDLLIKACFYKHMHNCMPNLVWFAKAGASIPAAEYQQVLAVCDTTFPNEPSPVEASPSEAVLPSAAPFDTITMETHFWDKEHREVAVKGQQTDQFKEASFVNPHVHKRGDTPTYFLSVEKRLAPATEESNRARMQANPRQDMCDEYDRLVPNPPLWTAAKHAEYVDLSVLEYQSKRTEKAVRSKLQAHDPSRTGSDIVISIKNQPIKKEEKRKKKEAIPGQLIHEYDISQTLGDAAYALFLENEIIPAFPPQFLFYRRMAPQDFIEAYKKRWRPGNGVYSSDVTRWDVGCDAAMLNFDVHVMRRSNFPEDYVQAYIHRRLTSKSQHGMMATMQNSGDRYTWPLNTVRRAVVTSIVCQVQPEDTCAVNGDDAAIDRCLTALPFPDSPWEFKDQNGYRGEFSGFELGGDEPTYSAEGLFYRSAILVSRDPSAQDKWVNYLDLLKFAGRDEPQAAWVAATAQRYMKPELFAQFLPIQFQPLFPQLCF